MMMSQRQRAITLPKLSFLSFDPTVNTAGQKKGATVEAGRPKDDVMNSVAKLETFSKQNPVKSRVDEAASAMLNDGALVLTGAQAGALLKRCRYARQTRDLTPAGADHVEVLADMMRRGQWRRCDQLDFARLKGVLILINGHHRLTAQQKADVSIEWNVMVHDCETNEEVAALYYSFDTNVRGRNASTVLNAMDASKLFGISKTTASGLFKCTPLLLSNFDMRKSSRDPVGARVIDRRMEVMKGFAKEAQAWEAATKSAPPAVRRKLLNQGAFSVAMMTFRHRPYEADQFYRGLSNNDGLKKGDPRNTYLTALLTMDAASGSSAYTARQAAVAWNAWMQGRQLSIIKVIESNTFRISGTPVGR
jgi:hypothetical protein